MWTWTQLVNITSYTPTILNFVVAYVDPFFVIAGNFRCATAVISQHNSRFQDCLFDAIYVYLLFVVFLTQDPICFIGGELYAAEEVGGCWDW
jgi:hypothetical protein